MEHLVTVGVVVEDEAVQKSVVNALRDKLYDQIKDAVLSSDYFYIREQDPRKQLKALAERGVEKFLENYKTEIIEEAASLLAEKLRNTKAIKEMVKGLSDEHQ